LGVRLMDCAFTGSVRKNRDSKILQIIDAFLIINGINE